MLTRSCTRSFFLCIAAVLFAMNSAHAQSTPGPVKMAVDLRDAPKHIFHAKLEFPVKPGPLTLVYPKWIQGEHAPTGPIVDLTGLKIRAAGNEVAWRRDDVDMYAFHLDVPSGADTLQVELDYLSPADSANGSRETPAATAQIAVLDWYLVTLYPQGAKTDDLTYVASLRLPAGWKYATALPVAGGNADTVEFAPASLTTLIDSPAITGAYFRTIDLAPGQKPEHFIHIAADGPGALYPGPAEVMHLRQLVAETGALFGARHYRRYDFLLAHEFTHSWNGKYRRPIGLVSPDYQTPLKGDLLWVYEGLTQYLGVMLTARSGFWTPEQLREYLAATAAYLNNWPGRTWRDLQDTAISAQILYGAPAAGTARRRGTDYYDESTLIWLEADTIIRRETHGKKSLDDFCRKFHGGESSGPKVVPYTFEDVVAGMNEVAPYDWRGFFTERLRSHGPGAPLGGLENAGWKIVFNENPNEHDKADEIVNQIANFAFSLGFNVHAPGGDQGDRVLDVIPGSPADLAGLAPGMHLVGVNGRKWSPELLHNAIELAKDSKEPIELLVENADYFKTCRIDYHGGERYPHLEPMNGKTDVLGEIARMKAPPVSVPINY